MWDFDPSWALSPEPHLVKKAMSNSRVILSHALIYNDGGFDISRCGRYLAICADFSLRQAEKEVDMVAEMDASSDMEQILATVNQEPAGDEVNGTDEVPADVAISNLQAPASMNDSSSSALAAAVTTGTMLPRARVTPMPMPIQPPARLLALPAVHSNTAPTMLVALQASVPDLGSLTMDQYFEQHIRRVRPRLHPPSGMHRHPLVAARNPVMTSVGASAAAAAAAATTAIPQQPYSRIRPNIALSRTRFTRNQRTRRGRLATENQSTWLALISLDPQQLGRVIQTCHLAETAAGGVTSVKISPTSSYVLLGYGVRDRIQRYVVLDPLH